MGKFEKVVVLAVLFLVTLILVVSLNTDEKEDLLHAALGGVEEGAPVAPMGSMPGAELGDWVAEDIDESLVSFFDPTSAPLSGRIEKLVEELPVAPIVTLPVGTILCEALGLVETSDPAVFLHSVEEGETYETLALRYYGDAGLTDMLRLANDDLQDVPMVESVIIPAFDQRLKRGDRLSGRTHTVKTGDTFTGISLEVYGDASDWELIYDANADVVSSPEALRPGMILRIP